MVPVAVDAAAAAAVAVDAAAAAAVVAEQYS
jgi:hypothetical protein